MIFMNKFYITTTLPYINAEPHIGFAAEIIKADCIARFRKMQGDEVFFNTGTDEHGLKVYRKAKEEGIEPQKYCDKLVIKYQDLKNALNLNYDNFIRTTDEKHIEAAKKFWKLCADNGDIYKKNYKIKYCVGCELEKTESEIINNRCPLHPDQELEIINEENYFFKFSNYQKKLLDLYKNNKNFVYPNHRLKEIIKFTERGLEDFSISRVKEKMPWGVEVPGDPTQVMYVWFDALVNYITAIGWPDNINNFNEWWPALQVAGKDNLRQQASMWQAMLMSAGLLNSKAILIFGFLTSNGQKMSKSLGNVISPFDLVNKYGTDAVRYFLLSEIPTFEDGDFSNKKFETKYNSDLSNGLGNLVARVTNMLEKNNIEINLTNIIDNKINKSYKEKMEKFKFDETLKLIWDIYRKNDALLSEKTPWKLNDKEEIKNILEPIANDIYNSTYLLAPFLPQTSEKIINIFNINKIKKFNSLFPRIN